MEGRDAAAQAAERESSREASERATAELGSPRGGSVELPVKVEQRVALRLLGWIRERRGPAKQPGEAERASAAPVQIFAL